MVGLKYKIQEQTNCDYLKHTHQVVFRLQLMRPKMRFLIHFHIWCIVLTMTLLTIPIEGVSYDFTDSPGKSAVNLSDIIVSLTGLTSLSPHNASTGNTTAAHETRRKPVMEKTIADDVPRDSPAALVIASSIAAVCILVFFVIAYLWHTHQLDSRARKLAIRLAADAESGLRSRSSGPQAARRYSKVTPKEKPRCVSESSEEQNHYVILPPGEERGPSCDTGRDSLAASESDACDNDDTFEHIKLPPIGERGNSGTRVGRGAHRKWNRSRKSVSGANLDKRGSAITDKEVLSHFASRRHSTFFI